MIRPALLLCALLATASARSGEESSHEYIKTNPEEYRQEYKETTDYKANQQVRSLAGLSAPRVCATLLPRAARPARWQSAEDI